MKKIIFIVLCLFALNSFADNFDATARYQVCFTPGGECTSLIVDAIKRSRKQILVQAYSFTSVPIAKALIQAHKKGIEVKIILDKSQYRDNGFSSAKAFTDYGIPVWIEYLPGVAHNKVMIIDNETVVTGSFNFTRAAQERNAENVIIINDPQLAKRYAKNWQDNLEDAKPLRSSSTPFDLKEDFSAGSKKIIKQLINYTKTKNH